MEKLSTDFSLIKSISKFLTLHVDLKTVRVHTPPVHTQPKTLFRDGLLSVPWPFWVVSIKSSGAIQPSPVWRGEEGNLCPSKRWTLPRGQDVMRAEGHGLHPKQLCDAQASNLNMGLQYICQFFLKRFVVERQLVCSDEFWTDRLSKVGLDAWSDFYFSEFILLSSIFFKQLLQFCLFHNCCFFVVFFTVAVINLVRNPNIGQMDILKTRWKWGDNNEFKREH